MSMLKHSEYYGPDSVPFMYLICKYFSYEWDFKIKYVINVEAVCVCVCVWNVLNLFWAEIWIWVCKILFALQVHLTNRQLSCKGQYQVVDNFLVLLCVQFMYFSIFVRESHSHRLTRLAFAVGFTQQRWEAIFRHFVKLWWWLDLEETTRLIICLSADFLILVE